MLAKRSGGSVFAAAAAISFDSAWVGERICPEQLEDRLARWLLMAHDRLEVDELSITHEFLSIMLGVRRPGVTVALNLLEEGV